MSSVIELDSSDDDDVTLVTQENLPKRKNNRKQYHIPKKYQVGAAMRRLFNLCISLEDSEGMERVIYKNILPHFKHCDKEYIDSTEFQKFLFDITQKMKGNNNRKFSCLKELSERLKENRLKKRVELITLDSEVSETTKRKHEIETSYQRKRFKSNTDTNSNQELKGEEIIKENNVIYLTDEEEGSERSSNNTPVIEIDDEKENSNNTNTFKVNSQSDDEIREPSPDLLSPTCKIVDSDAEDDDRSNRIEAITNLINENHAKIRQYEMQEVDNDGNTSPYIACHRLKEEIIILYKELSDLEGTDYLARKVKNIRLTVASGHPPGPAKVLEHWLNENTVNGVPPFPDFTDVAKCVMQANTRDNLGWTPKQIYREARMLLVQCGEDLQTRRQKREWRHMTQWVEGEMVDPADHDAELRAKLESNRVIAKKNEHNIIQRFVDLESQHREKKIIKKINNSIENVTELVNNENEGIITSNVHEANDKTDLNNVDDSKDKPTVSRLLDIESKSVNSDESTDNESEVNGESIIDDNKILNKPDVSQASQIDSEGRQEESKQLNNDITEEAVKGKSEIKIEQDVWDENCEDVFEAMLKSEFVDGNFETNIFDIEEKVITIEISSSESEYDSDEECE